MFRAGGTPSAVVLVDTGIVSSRVLSTSKRTTDALVDLTVRSSDGVESTITGTPGHPFYVPAAHDYVAMGKLTAGTVLRAASGSTVSVVRGTERHGAFTVHNFVVDRQHNYYVSDAQVLVHNGCIRNGGLAGGTHSGGVPFDADGFPEFPCNESYDIEYTGTRNGDYAAANAKAGYAQTPEGMTWHHHQNGRTMQLVDKALHARTGHTGGFSLHPVR